MTKPPAESENGALIPSGRSNFSVLVDLLDIKLMSLEESIS